MGFFLKGVIFHSGTPSAKEIISNYLHGALSAHDGAKSELVEREINIGNDWEYVTLRMLRSEDAIIERESNGRLIHEPIIGKPLGGETAAASAYAATTFPNRDGLKCYNCQKAGHTTRNCT